MMKRETHLNKRLFWQLGGLVTFHPHPANQVFPTIAGNTNQLPQKLFELIDLRNVHEIESPTRHWEHHVGANKFAPTWCSSYFIHVPKLPQQLYPIQKLHVRFLPQAPGIFHQQQQRFLFLMLKSCEY